MLAIRMQRTGRKGHAMFRVVVQDARRTPTSGKIVASIGNYDPHAKTLTLDKDKALFYLEHGAQPSERAARLLKEDGVKLPAWVSLSGDQKRTVRNPDKRRSTRPAEPEQPAAAEPAETEEAKETVAPADTATQDSEAEESAKPETEAPQSPAVESESTEESPESKTDEKPETPADEVKS